VGRMWCAVLKRNDFARRGVRYERVEGGFSNRDIEIGMTRTSKICKYTMVIFK
jgi:hypothetical protein